MSVTDGNPTARNAQDILNSLKEKMELIKQTLASLLNGPAIGKAMNLANLLIWSRIVISETENLRGIDRKRFNEWYAPFHEKLFGLKGSVDPDPLLNYFLSSRNELEHVGTLRVGRMVHISKLALPQDLQRFGPPPRGAKGFFIGDQLGGSGWSVELPDGKMTKVYVEFPRDQVQVSLLPPVHPKVHLGHNVEGKSVEEMAELYVSYLDKMVQSAMREFK